MKITVVCVGKLKEEYLRAAQAEYVKRLGAYVKLAIVEVAEEKAPEGLSDREIELLLTKEGARIEKALGEGVYAVALAIDGEGLSSEDFAGRWAGLAVGGVSHMAFVIGGSLGLSGHILKRCRMRLSLSDMTFPHQIARVLLLEQIYRAQKINNNEPYHK